MSKPDLNENKSDSSFDIKKFIRRILWLLPLSVAVNIAFALIFTDSSELLRVRSFAPGFFLLAAGLRLLPWVIKSLRLWNWMDFLGHPFSFWEGFRISMMTELGVVVSPTAIGGEPVKTGMLYERGVSFGESASLTSIAVVEDFTFYLLGIPIAIFFSSAWKIAGIRQLLQQSLSSIEDILLIVGIVVIVLLIVAFILVKSKLLARIRKKIEKFWSDFINLYNTMLKSGKGRFAVNLLLTAIHWTARYSVVTALVLSLGYDVDPVRFFVLQWLVFAIMTMVPTPGATGGAEGVFLIIFGAVLPGNALGTVLIGWRFLDFYFLSILALIILGIDGLIQKFSNSSESKTE